MGPHLRSLLAGLGGRDRSAAHDAAERDDGPVSFLTLGAGTPVLDRFGAPVGPVERVLTITSICHFDGIIVSTRAGSRFVDAPEVGRIEHGAVRLSIACADVEHRGPQTNGVPGARIGRTEATERDRAAVIDRLKHAYVEDRLSAHELGDRIESVHTASTLDELDALLRLD